MFKKILIANRGEIACRVIKTARRMGIATVAVYSDADRDALHVEMADEAVHIGPAPAAQSYLVAEKIIAACKATGAEAVHPGYGFLSERASFCEALEEQGIVFIGPKPKAIKAMGDKIEFEEIRQCRQGHHRARPSRRHRGCRPCREDRRRDRLSRHDQGLGRRRRQGHAHRLERRPKCATASSAPARRRRARSATTASSSRNSSSSRATSRSRCWPMRMATRSISASANARSSAATRRSSRRRRRPSSTKQTRKAMGEQAVALAKAVDYQSAGTVEFIVDSDRNFYFLEMNTRLQVEHPVTELVTGIDLVEQMIRVAAGEKLPIAAGGRQARRLGGRKPALCRRSLSQLPALDRPPDALPAAGGRHGPAMLVIRNDTGVSEGSEISMYYDPMIAKLCTWAPTAHRGDRGHGRRARRVRRRRHRAQHSVPVGADAASALARRAAVDRLHRRGISRTASRRSSRTRTTRPCLRRSPCAVELIAPRPPRPADRPAGAAFRRAKRDWVVKLGADYLAVSMWSRARSRFRSTSIWRSRAARPLTVVLRLAAGRPGLAGQVGGAQHHRADPPAAERLPHRLAGHFGDGQASCCPRIAELDRLMPVKVPPDTSNLLLCPMPGLVVSIAVAEGQEVKAGETLAVVEAMKMENVLRAERDLSSPRSMPSRATAWRSMR